MEWNLKLSEVDSVMEFEIFKGLYMRLQYGSQNNRIQYKGSEEQLVSMGFSKIGEVGRLSLYITVGMVTIPCYKGKILLPNNEVVDIVLCVDEECESSVLCFPHFLFDRIIIDVKNKNVVLDADITALKVGIKHSNELYLQELNGRIEG